MDPVIGAALIGAGGQVLADQQSAASVSRQMQFQERMSSTAYQRAMQDMREAGLNPILAAKVGGASSPGGASHQYGNVGAAATQGYQQASAARLQQEQSKKPAIEIDKMHEEMSNLRTERARIGWLVSKAFYESDNARKTGRLIGFEANRVEEMWKIASEELKLIKGDVKAMQELQNIGRYSKELKPIADFLLNLIGGGAAGYLIKKGFSKKAPSVLQRGIYNAPAVRGR